jgi:arabinogalactan oligomer/maltooligosaccharide transport system permease protein
MIAQPRARGRATGRAVRLAVLAALLVLVPALALEGQTATEVVLWHPMGAAEERGLLAAVEEFERRTPEIRVRVAAIPWGAYGSKLEAAIPVHRGPDLFIEAHNRARAYLEAGLIQPLGAADVSDFEPEHVAALTLDGALYGVPISIKGAALYLNAALIGDRTIESLEDLESLALPSGTFALAWEVTDAYEFAALLHAYGGEMLGEDGRYRFVGPEAEAAIAHLERLVRNRVVPEESSYELVRDLFGSGRAAAAIGGPWLANDLPAELRYSVRPLPIVRATGRPLIAFGTIESALIASTARDPEAARRVATFLASADGARIRALEGDHVVASRSAWSDPAVAGRQRLRAFRDASARARPMSSHRHMHAVFRPAERALRRALRGDGELGAVLEEGRTRFEDETREPPPPRDPLAFVVALGVVLLFACFAMLRQARDPAFRRELRGSLPAYAWIAHAVIAIGVLVVLPLAVGAATSFFAGHGRDLHYVGLANYVEILTARGGDLLGRGSFWTVLLVTVLWTVCNVVFHVAIGVSLALLLHRPTLALRGFYRVLLVLPWAVPSYVTALAWRGMFHRQFGAVNAVLEALGAEPISWFAQWSTAFAANVATNVWLGFPFMMVVTLGALTAIPRDLYEAAEVDGATRWQQFRHVTLPLLLPSLAPAVAMGAVWTFNMFNVVYLVSAGEPDGTTEILVSEAYRWAFTRGHQYGYAAAYAVLIFLLLFASTRALSRAPREALR